ncbi:MAG: hypothetical protein IKQ10_10510 [Oscillospiraceae bacterium]|nr:hypothetical protein [Oscillospiraceae bacterium]
MADRVVPGPIDSSALIREAVCIHTKKIYSSCRDKDCVEDLRVFPTVSSQTYIDSAYSVRPRSAELLSAVVDVEEINFNRGYYTVDVTYYYRVTGEIVSGGTTVVGLSVFNKRVILFGSEGSVKVYSSEGDVTTQADQPVGVVEAVDPIALAMQLVDKAGSGNDPIPDVPPGILALFGEDLVFDADRLWYTTLGQFSLIRLERDSQLVIPVYNYSVPENECDGTVDDDPCSLFGRIRFPVEEFYPPDRIEPADTYRGLIQ